jgi:hypothetical protein
LFSNPTRVLLHELPFSAILLLPLIQKQNGRLHPGEFALLLPDAPDDILEG